MVRFLGPNECECDLPPRHHKKKRKEKHDKYRFKLLYAITVFRVPVKVPKTKSLKLSSAKNDLGIGLPTQNL